VPVFLSTVADKKFEKGDNGQQGRMSDPATDDRGITVRLLWGRSWECMGIALSRKLGEYPLRDVAYFFNIGSYFTVSQTVAWLQRQLEKNLDLKSRVEKTKCKILNIKI
jgi:hypothetical protein